MNDRLLFLSDEQRALFLDTLDAMAWERGHHDASRVVPMWEHQFASSLDPVQGPSPWKLY